MTPSPACYALVRNAEGCRLTSYQDGNGIWTVGVGHTPSHEGETISWDQAEQLLESDMAGAAEAVNRLAMPCTQNQFDALVSFTFNEGQGRLAGSTLLHKHKAGDFAGAAAEFGKWVYCGHQVEAGLVKRRAQEAHLYLGEPL